MRCLHHLSIPKGEPRSCRRRCRFPLFSEQVHRLTTHLRDTGEKAALVKQKGENLFRFTTAGSQQRQVSFGKTPEGVFRSHLPLLSSPLAAPRSLRHERWPPGPPVGNRPPEKLEQGLLPTLPSHTTPRGLQKEAVREHLRSRLTSWATHRQDWGRKEIERGALEPEGSHLLFPLLPHT